MFTFVSLNWPRPEMHSVIRKYSKLIRVRSESYKLFLAHSLYILNFVSGNLTSLQWPRGAMWVEVAPQMFVISDRNGIFS